MLTFARMKRANDLRILPRMFYGENFARNGVFDEFSGRKFGFFSHPPTLAHSVNEWNGTSAKDRA